MKRTLSLIAGLATSLFVLGLLSAGRACAHDPRFACSPRSADNPVAIEDVSKSWAFYGRLAPEQRDVYVFATTRAVVVPMSILIDERDATNPARPAVVVYDRDERVVGTSDLARIVTFYEPFSRVRYLSSPERLLSLSAGSYTAVVSMKGGNVPQRYAFAIGREERFSVFEIPYVLGAIYRINQRRF